MDSFPSRPLQRKRMCSTPFGITDEWTRSIARWPSRWPCAQRLSASRMNGPPDAPAWTRASMGAQRLSASRMNGLSVSGSPITAAGTCSTPFGITDEWTNGGWEDSYPRIVCSTPFGITDEWTTGEARTGRCCSGAQRLSASRMNGQARGARTRLAIRCAQRLSASRMNGLMVIPRVVLDNVVLNAFRHHG